MFSIFSMTRPALPLVALACVLLAACGGGEHPVAAAPAEQAAAAGTDVQAAHAIPARGSSDAGRPVKGGAGREAAAAVPRSKLYIVQLAEPPVLAYEGSAPGYARTRPAKGGKMDSAERAVVDYAARLVTRQERALAAAGAAKKYSYRYAFNGFAAELSEHQLSKLATTEGVLSIVEDEMRTLHTSTTPE